MSNRKRQILFVAVFAMVAGRALADRLQSPLQIGSGSAAASKAIFDTGNGSSNAYVGASSGGALQLSNDGGTHIVSIPTINDTAVTLGAAQTLTVKTLTSPVMTTPTVSSGNTTLVGGGTAGTQGFKVAIYSGSLSNGNNTTITAPSGVIVGTASWDITTGQPFPACNSGSILCFSSALGGASFTIANATGLTHSYFVTLFYQ